MTTDDSKDGNSPENSQATSDDRDIVLTPDEANIPEGSQYEDVEDCEPLREGDEESEMYPYGSVIKTPDNGDGVVNCGAGDPTTMFIAVTGLTTDALPEAAVRQLTGQVHGYLSEDLGIRAASVSVVTDLPAFLTSIDAPLSCPNCNQPFDSHQEE